MSIPKEPRQLMINIMYLVLTAMLALNVSAEIINAFFMIDRGIAGSNTVLQGSNDLSFKALELNAAQDLARYQPLIDGAEEVRTLSTEFNRYIDELRELLVEKSGGYYPEDHEDHPGQPVGYKNKDVTTRVLVNGYNEGGQEVDPRGPELEERILQAKSRLLEIVNRLKGIPGTTINDETLAELENSITLGISDDWEKARRPVNWAHFTFNHMPLASVFPILRKFQNDMKSSEAAVLNYLVNQVGATTFKVDNFIPISSARKSYIIAGDEYESEITVGASSKSVYENMRIAVNGRQLDVDENGVAMFSERPTSTGIRKYNVSITLTNPTTNEVETYEKEFEYEVGRRSVSVAAEKMNVFYIGVDNPVSVAAAGVSSNDLRVSGSGSGLSLRRTGEGKYVATVSQPGDATISVSGGGLSPTNFAFRVKRIPDPQARLSGSVGGSIGSGEFKAQGGVGAFLDNFDFDATCQVTGFTLVRVPPRQDAIESVNAGPRYTAQSRRLVDLASPGDRYFFDNVRAKCPGDNATRQINSMAFRIQ